MHLRRWRFWIGVLALGGATSACDAIDRARGGGATADTTVVAGGLALGLQVPGTLRPGEEGVVRLTITNRGDTVASRMRVELIVPAWAEPMPPRAGDPEVSMSRMEDGGTRFTFRMEDTPLEANQSHLVEQRIRVPAVERLGQGAAPWARVVRARLLGPQGQALSEVESEIALEGLPPPESAPAFSAAELAEPRTRLGPVELGMQEQRLREEVPAARDTTWSQEGMPQRGLVVPAPGNGRALAVLAGDSVARIEVSDPAVRTREQFGVGSRLGELRSAYGVPCADVGEGVLVVWFPSAPGISFALDAPAPANVAQLRANPDVIPASARVTRWWLRRGVDTCPR